MNENDLFNAITYIVLFVYIRMWDITIIMYILQWLRIARGKLLP